ncbi:tagatose 1,6-diphosphate aldolase [Herbiconiux sp. UC225_62]|uniref:tagatose 1,6-diphosphate aldolase n=1 Tax=Herbiconiux sp. UC225_62 TaxID=3350168 RepID=UPI0036D3BC1C
MTSRTHAPIPADLGKVRSLRRTTSDDGFFTLCAIDHLSDFQILLDSDPTRVSYRSTVDAKGRLIAALADSVSGFLVDPRYSYAQSVLSDAIPSSSGVMVSLEDDGYLGVDTDRATRMRDGWGVRQAKLAGADVVKLLWFYRPESTFAQAQRDLVTSLAAEAADWAIPLVVEPIWHPLAGEDATAPEWRIARAQGIVQSGKLAVELGADVLKTEFPGDLRSNSGVERAGDALAELDESIDVPWVILSAGVAFDEFTEQAELSGKAGASGWLAGRSIWREAGSATTETEWTEGLEMARSRLATLTEITKKYGRPFLPSEKTDSTPDRWYEGYHQLSADDIA